MIANIRRTVEQHHLFEKGDRVLVAVSGGVDSMVLLDCLVRLRQEWAIELGVVHVEHGLRGEESLGDALFVEEMARQYGLPFYRKRFDVARLAEEQGLSTQVMARQVRYEYLAEAARAFGAGKIATAHHADDQAETVLMRVLRGTTLRGLGGIRASRFEAGLEIVRPLIDVWRAEIESYGTEHGILYREDSSNALTKYLRNKIRIRLFPLLEREYNPGVKRSLVQISEWARDDERLLADLAQGLFDEAVEREKSGKIRVYVKTLAGKPLPLQRRVITLILYYLRGNTRQWEHAHVELVRSLLTGDSPSAEVTLPEGISAWREYDILFVGDASERVSRVPDEAGEGLQPLDWQKPGRLELPRCGIRLEWEIVKSKPARPTDAWEAQFDADELSGSCIYIRTWAQGDTLHPFGFHGTKLISDVLGEAKVPKRERADWPLVCINETIAWVVGIRRGQQAAVTEQTSQTLVLRASKLAH
ncbi:MAG: tRNA lysidine(34) synthetase TilS [Tumebacillaceae bacterium]